MSTLSFGYTAGKYRSWYRSEFLTFSIIFSAFYTYAT